ncbi:hypothetical protein SERLADRAFT_436677 [Serpula lacrymans var. lacrymans S7.9]|uniref:Uncharacterized protein n=1 Tax=Serpula lacrymans var. lacrymans (strain S7.9) TaxID=578457 RepID=F8NRW4_SERL9|nr:uncharacterized protein SERLADRAFT_436677 [Serpula lacrymans var. lacrymans S7.9]EGO26850.1 hypothetical protein SERLADRAFT_436677 [Serpula lacrymans var. lacrymans S7.9]
MRNCDCGFVLDPPDNIAALSTDSVGQDDEGVNTKNTYKTTAVPASPLERGPGETNTRVLNSGKNKIEKHVSFDNSSSSLEPLPTEILRHVLICTYLFQKEICLDIGVENLARALSLRLFGEDITTAAREAAQKKGRAAPEIETARDSEEVQKPGEDDNALQMDSS